MSKTITIVRSDGRKVRTAYSRRFYVTVATGDPNKAWVAKRTDDPSAAWYETTRQGATVEVYDAVKAQVMPLADLRRWHEAKLRRKRAERAQERAYNPNLF